MTVGFAGHERLGLLEAVAELAAERLAAHELLVAAHLDRVGPERWPAGAPRAQPAPGSRSDTRRSASRRSRRRCRSSRRAAAPRPGRRRSGRRRAPASGRRARRAVGGEALVLGHVVGRHARRGVADVRHRARGIADVLVEQAVSGRRRPRQRAAGVEVERRRLQVLRRPGVEPPELVRCRSRTPRLRAGSPACPSGTAEERELDLLAEELSGQDAEVHVAERRLRYRATSRRATTAP